MTIGNNEQVVSGDTVGKARYSASSVKPKTFAAGAGTILKLTPVTFNETTNFWQKWSGKHNEIDTISSAGVVSGGNWTITIDGQTTGNIAHNANAATIQAAVNALGGIAHGDVTVTGGPLSTNTSVILTFGGKFLHKVVTVSATLGGLTGGGAGTFTQTQAGVNTTGVKGFMFEDLTLAAGNESVANVMLAGMVHINDIVLPAGETLNVLKAALRVDCRPLGLDIDGLNQVR